MGRSTELMKCLSRANADSLLAFGLADNDLSTSPEADQVLLVGIHLLAGNHEDANKIVDQFQAEDDLHLEAMACVLIHEGFDLARSLEFMERAVTIEETYRRSLFCARGCFDSHHTQGLSRSLYHAKKAVEQKPNEPNAHALVAEVCFRWLIGGGDETAGEVAIEGIEAITHAINDLDSQNPKHYVYLALYQGMTGNIVYALETIEQGLALEQNTPASTRVLNDLTHLTHSAPEAY